MPRHSFSDQPDPAVLTLRSAVTRITLGELRSELPNSSFIVPITQRSCKLISKDCGMRTKVFQTDRHAVDKQITPHQDTCSSNSHLAKCRRCGPKMNRSTPTGVSINASRTDGGRLLKIDRVILIHSKKTSD